MGRASSAKKVAKAAKAGGNVKTSEGRKWGFPALVGLIVGLGVLGIVAIAVFGSDEEAVAPTLNDHWHSAYGVYICDTFLPNQVDQQGDQVGIHTHEDGLIHIHPFSSSAAGTNARFGVFAEEVGIELGDGTFTLADGTTHATGDDCSGEEGEVQLLRWAVADFEGEPEVITTDLANVRFLGDGEAFVLALAPAGAEIPLPPNLAELANPTDLAPGESPPDIEIPDGTSDTTTDTTAALE